MNRSADAQRQRPGVRARWVVAVCLAATVALCGGVAASGPSPTAIANAKTLFKAGAQAYADDDFEAALHAFGAARALIPDPALTFSIAQAHRRQYYVDQSSTHLRSAVAEYRRYLSTVKKGGRRGDAAEALVELETKLEGLDESLDPVATPSRQSTRLMVLSSVEGAQVSIDDAPSEEAPFIGEIEPGNHVVRVTAAGYHPYVRTLQIQRGQVAPVDANLEELPAQLLVRGDEGATLWVDGRPHGLLPMSVPIAVPPGRRLVGVTKDGHRRFELETQLDRGKQKDLDVALEVTAQRTVSVVTLSLAGGSVVASGVLAAVAGARYHDSLGILEQYDSGRIDEAQLEEYDQGRLSHMPYTVAAIATGVAGLALGLTGGLLFLLDDPAPASQVGASPEDSPQVRIGVAPHADGAQLGAEMRF